MKSLAVACRLGVSFVIGMCLLGAPGCVVIPLSELLEGTSYEEQVLVEGAGWLSKDKIALVDIEGVIDADGGGGLLFADDSAVAETKAQLDRVREDGQVKAVVLRISSPGGEVGACDAIAHELAVFKRDTELPVVGCIREVGASGGYYVAVGCDVLYAEPTAIVGSIGVLLWHVELSGLMEKVGVSATAVKAGAKKDMRSLFRPLSGEEREVLQEVVDDMYARFVDVVKTGRPSLTREDILALADGRVVSAGDAVDLGLIDKRGYLSDAIEEARRRAGIRSPTVVRYTRGKRVGANIYSGPIADGSEGAELRLSLGSPPPPSPRLYYLWLPF